MNMALEVVYVPVSDVKKSKDFYEHKLGFKADFDTPEVVQLTPPGSQCSIHIGTGIVDSKPGSIKGLMLVVDSVAQAKKELETKGVKPSKIDEFPWGKHVNFSDPDGNSWTLQESYARNKQRTQK